ncbi:hypothetical protein DXG03_003110 [Asterophora parasitica]|uniref:Uncharacterized protein n=1 Tax=Asterophora parasitica TaxID=117018 RepID=A0A9P7GF65_9AGAR|nr:hypothetical protein DXG03_003110 [Asterophora parasitica]
MNVSRFVGTIVRKQVFVQIYAWFIYVHLLLSIGVTGYLLYMVTHFSKNATAKACQETIQNQQAKEQCTGLLDVARSVYFVVKNEKRSARASRLDNEEAFALVSKSKGRYSSLPGDHDESIPVYAGREEFDPYDGLTQVRRSTAYDGVPSHPDGVGYGGGNWKHSDISTEEKTQMKQRDYMEEAMEQNGEETGLRLEPSRRVPPTILTPGLEARDDLPRYTLSDPSPIPASK